MFVNKNKSRTYLSILMTANQSFDVSLFEEFKFRKFIFNSIFSALNLIIFFKIIIFKI